MNTEQIFSIAERNGIKVVQTSCPTIGSCSLKLNDQYWIGIDSKLSGCEEKEHLAHEVGHCVTGSLYNLYAPLDNRRKHELRADRWAIAKLVPIQKLRTAIIKGIRSNYELADHFEVTEDFMKRALKHYADKGVLLVDFD